MRMQSDIVQLNWSDLQSIESHFRTFFLEWKCSHNFYYVRGLVNSKMTRLWFHHAGSQYVYEWMDGNTFRPKFQSKIDHSHSLCVNAINFNLHIFHCCFSFPPHAVNSSTSFYWRKILALNLISLNSLIGEIWINSLKFI